MNSDFNQSLEELNTSYKQHLSVYETQILKYKKKEDETKEKINELEHENAKFRQVLDIAKQSNDDLEQAYRAIHLENSELKNQVVPVPKNHWNVDNLEKLEQQLFGLLKEKTSWIEDQDKTRQRIGFLERECKRNQTENLILAKQVQHLIRTLEEERGMIIRTRNEVVNDDNIIDEQLITFESILELQQNNQRILGVCKDLAKRNEELETKFEGEDLYGLKSHLKDLKRELDESKQQREKQMNLIRDLTQQRDLFKILLSKTRQVDHMTPEIFQRMVSVACSASPAITGSSEIVIPQDATYIQELQKQISWLQDELEKLRMEKQQETSHYKEAIDKLLVLKEELSKTNTKFCCELDELSKDNVSLKNNLESTLKVSEEFKLRSQKYLDENSLLIDRIREEKELSKRLSTELELEKKSGPQLLALKSQLTYFKEHYATIKMALKRERKRKKPSSNFGMQDLKQRYACLKEKIIRERSKSSLLSGKLQKLEESIKNQPASIKLECKDQETQSTDQIPDQLPDQVLDQLPDQILDQLPDQILDRLPDHRIQDFKLRIAILKERVIRERSKNSILLEKLQKQEGSNETKERSL